MKTARDNKEFWVAVLTDSQIYQKLLTVSVTIPLL